jgi:hypothetical protein
MKIRANAFNSVQRSGGVFPLKTEWLFEGL